MVNPTRLRNFSDLSFVTRRIVNWFTYACPILVEYSRAWEKICQKNIWRNFRWVCKTRCWKQRSIICRCFHKLHQILRSFRSFGQTRVVYCWHGRHKQYKLPRMAELSRSETIIYYRKLGKGGAKRDIIWRLIKFGTCKENWWYW